MVPIPMPSRESLKYCNHAGRNRLVANPGLSRSSFMITPKLRRRAAIGYRGWIVMETANPSKDAVLDAKRNGAYIRRLFGIG